MVVSPAFVGRRAERSELRRAWEDVKRGSARVVGLVGGSGIGKTALVERFVHDVGPSRLA